MLSFSALAVTTVEAQAYVTARLLTGWPAGTAEQTAALRRGQDYIAREYNYRWTVDVTDAAAPDVVKYAIVEAALAEAKSPGSLSPVASSATAKVLTEVKGIRWTPLSSVGKMSPSQLMTPVLTSVEAMLRSVVLPNNQAFALVV
jgi:hypothetical protein